MAIATHKPTMSDMQRCVARFKDLERCTTGTPDQALPECNRAFLSVLGFKQPEVEGQYSPFGNASQPKVTHIEAGFGMSFIAAEPGKGVIMHTHDTVETFMVMKGTWMVEWEGPQGDEHVVLDPLDFIACPIGIQRRFECISAAPGEKEGLLLGVIAGTAPAAEIAPRGIARLVEAGIFQPQPA